MPAKSLKGLAALLGRDVEALKSGGSQMTPTVSATLVEPSVPGPRSVSVGSAQPRLPDSGSGGTADQKSRHRDERGHTTTDDQPAPRTRRMTAADNGNMVSA